MKSVVKSLALCAVSGLLLATLPARAQETAPGLAGHYWEMLAEELQAEAKALEDYPDVATQKPVIARADATVNIESTQEALPGTMLVENFYIRWTGKIRIAKEGDYTFTTESDDGSRLLIDGKQVVDNGGLHGAQEASGDVRLTAGDHDIKIEFFEGGGDASMKASWATQGVDKQIIPATVLFHKAEGKDDLQPGLWAEYFDFGAGVFPQPPVGRQPNYKRVARTINVEQTADTFGDTAFVDNFFARWTGTIKIPKDGKYTFTTESDDGSRLLIDGKVIVSNGGPHGMQEASGDIELKAGDHAIVIEYYEIGGDAGMKVSWAAEGMEKAIIPENVFSHKKADE